MSRENRDETWDNCAPRVGFAYSFTPRTVARAGFGLSFLATTGGFVRLGSTGFTSQTSYVASVDGNQPSETLNNPFPQGIVSLSGSSLGPLTGLGTRITANVRSLTTGYAQQWSANLQQQVGDWAVEFGYIGTHGVFRRRLCLPSSSPGSYTFSKLLDNNLWNGENIYADTGSNTVQNWDNLDAEKAVSASSMPQHVVVSGNYILPFGKTGTRLYKNFIGGWQLNGIFTAESGDLIRVTANAPAYGGGIHGSSRWVSIS